MLGIGEPVLLPALGFLDRKQDKAHFWAHRIEYRAWSLMLKNLQFLTLQWISLSERALVTIFCWIYAFVGCLLPRSLQRAFSLGGVYMADKVRLVHHGSECAWGGHLEFRLYLCCNQDTISIALSGLCIRHHLQLAFAVATYSELL